MNIILTVIHKALDSIGTLITAMYQALPSYSRPWGEDYLEHRLLLEVQKNRRCCPHLDHFRGEIYLLSPHCVHCLLQKGVHRDRCH
ncbi:hypothetical protein ES703_49555 [subsurface metagenome]